MNWQRGWTRVYLVVWFLWAGYLVFGWVASHVKYDRLYRAASGAVLKPEEYEDAIRIASLEAKLHKKVSIRPTTFSLDRNPSWYLHPPIASSDAKPFLLAFVLPAALFFALRWMAEGFLSRA